MTNPISKIRNEYQLGLTHLAKKITLYLVRNVRKVIMYPNYRIKIRSQPRIIIYQMGKVGSSTLYHSAIQSGYVDVHHTHHHEKAKHLIKHGANRTIIIICGVRELLSQCISTYFECFYKKNSVWHFGNLTKLQSASVIELINDFNRKYKTHLEQTIYPWFDRFCSVLDLKLDDLSFKGGDNYSETTRQNITVFIYKLEAMHEFEAYLKSHPHIKIKSFSPENVTEEKPIAAKYREFKSNLNIFREQYEKDIMCTPWLQDFYDREETIELAGRYFK